MLMPLPKKIVSKTINEAPQPSKPQLEQDQKRTKNEHNKKSKEETIRFEEIEEDAHAKAVGWLCTLQR